MPIALVMAITGILLMFNPNAEPMTKEQKVLQGTYLTVHAIDWRQTRYIAKHPDEFSETNPLLGENPSTSKVDNLMLSIALLHTGITKSLPSEHRMYWQMFTLGFKVGYVEKNIYLGIGMDF